MGRGEEGWGGTDEDLGDAACGSGEEVFGGLETRAVGVEGFDVGDGVGHCEVGVRIGVRFGGGSPRQERWTVKVEVI